MHRYEIEGGRRLNGSVVPSGNKNEALPVLAAALLATKPVTLDRLPRIGDVLTMIAIMEDLGSKVEWTGDERVVIDNSGLKYKTPRADLCAKIRASILLLGPMLARFGKVELPLPGGDVIGARRIDTHWDGIIALGGKMRMDDGIKGEINKPVGAEFFLDEPSVTATENLLSLASLASGTTVLMNAASEPHVVGVCNFLNVLGAKITGIGSNRVTIAGVSQLGGGTYRIGADFMEVGSFLCLGAMCGGKIEIKDINVEDFRFINKVFHKLGINVESGTNSLSVDGTRPMVMANDVSGRVSTTYSGPWPAFPTDLMSVAIVAATQSRGTMLFFEKMFEGRMFFTDKLIAMGAQIILCDPHRVVVNGSSKLFGSRLTSPDIRAGMALLMAALSAQGNSEIDNIQQIERGYSNIDKKLLSLGAALKRTTS
jgi:UDP-N-acetylglucosamine 1-carboxyvinyltransferase